MESQNVLSKLAITGNSVHYKMMMRKRFFWFGKTQRIFFDHAAGTPLAADSRAAMEPYLGGASGNPSAIHAEGVNARRAVENARGYVAQLFGAHTDEIVFTAGGTEANNIALFGAAFSPAARLHGSHIVTTSFEHHSVLRPLEELRRRGFEVTFVAPEPSGVVDPKKIAAAVRSDTILVSVIAAQNEIGTI